MDKNAFFIGTTLDGIELLKLFDNGKNNIISRNLYYFENMTESKDLDNPYGRTYKVSLGKKENEEHYFSKHASTEYMVSIDELKRIADKYNLVFAGKQTFEEWYDNYPNKKRKSLSQEEKEFSFKNFSFAFKKTVS